VRFNDRFHRGTRLPLAAMARRAGTLPAERVMFDT
jgi:hypothetical protein